MTMMCNVVVSSDSGHDAASESLDLMLTTTLSRDPSNEPVLHNDIERRDSIDTGCDERWSRHGRDDENVWTDGRNDSWLCTDENRVDNTADDVDRFYDAMELSRDMAAHGTVSCERHSTVSTHDDTNSATLCNGRLYHDSPPPPPPPSSSSSSSSSRLSSRVQLLFSSLALSLLLIVCGLSVLTYIVVESDVDMVIVSSVRRLPEVCEFYRDHYVPWRHWLLGPHQHSDLITRWPCVTHRPQGRKWSSQRHRKTATV